MTDQRDPPDLYAVNGEWYDAVSASMWTPLGPALARVLAPLGVAEGTVVDLGAGTGLGTQVLARSAPGCEVLAIEPSASLRTGLMSRVVADDDLRSRVTVLCDLGGAIASLPPSLAGFSALNMLGHLDASARRLLWQVLGERLEPGGLAVVGLQPPGRPETVPERDFGGQQVGRRSYGGSARAEPSGPGQVTWHLRWTCRQDGVVVEERRASSTWWTVSAADLERETSVAGLRCTVADADLGLFVLTTSSPAAASPPGASDG